MADDLLGEETRRLLAAATPRPWAADTHYGDVTVDDDDEGAGGFVVLFNATSHSSEADTLLVAAAPRLLAGLLAERDAAVARVAELTAQTKPWHFIMENDHNIDYASGEDHRYAVSIGNGTGWCAGCLAAPPSRYVEVPGNWPSLYSAPNGLRLQIELATSFERVARRPLCPAAPSTPAPTEETNRG